jgi:hypothetical protein
MTFWATESATSPLPTALKGSRRITCRVRRHGVELVIAYDRDEAGDRAAEKLAERLMAGVITCHRVLFPKGMDANEYALRVQPADRSLAWRPQLRLDRQRTKEPAAAERRPARPPRPEKRRAA